ncbi:MAG: DEAD/DEAH box helicase [Nitrospirae bacterium]|nr:DEAD/DEAH box helicase [Nitrospirota bacterium]
MNVITREARPMSVDASVTITPDSDKTTASFEDLNIGPEILLALKKMGFKHPTPIQSETLELALRGADVIGQAQTGTGKTAAFGIPIIEKINPADFKVQALVIAPTRELVIQVAEELNRIGREKGVYALAVYGGQAISLQIEGLKRRAHIVVGTPGRLIDHLNRKTLRLNQVTTAVLDEADVMLDMGFIDDITELLKEIPKERQTLLFSATLSEPILQIGKKYMQNPTEIRINRKNVTVASVKQVYYETSNHNRFDTLCRILDVSNPSLTLIFCDTKINVDRLTAQLVKGGYPSEAIHGDLSQSQRDHVMKLFKGGTVKTLVATDVAARGINVSDVSHVINYNLPKNHETYIHRIGRTARAGKEGEAITLITPGETRNLKMIETRSKTRIEKKEIPSDTLVAKSRLSKTQSKIEMALKKGAVKKYAPLISELYTSFSPEELACALFYLHDFTDPVVIKEEPKKEGRRTGFGSETRRDRERRPSFRDGEKRRDGFKPRDSFKSRDEVKPRESFRSRDEVKPRDGFKKDKTFGEKKIYMMPVMTRTKKNKTKSD